MTNLVSQLVGALNRLYVAAPTGLECNSFHHSKGEFHSHSEPCKPAAEYVEALAQARAALTAAKAGGWQSMETMPKEGKFLVYMPTQRVNQIQAARRHNGLLIIGNAFAFDVSDKPTAWQPLPNPPKEQSAGGPGSVDAVADPLSPT